MKILGDLDKKKKMKWTGAGNGIMGGESRFWSPKSVCVRHKSNPHASRGIMVVFWSELGFIRKAYIF